jgi:hypothetical protein
MFPKMQADYFRKCSSCSHLQSTLALVFALCRVCIFDVKWFFWFSLFVYVCNKYEIYSFCVLTRWCSETIHVLWSISIIVFVHSSLLVYIFMLICVVYLDDDFVSLQYICMRWSKSMVFRGCGVGGVFQSTKPDVNLSCTRNDIILLIPLGGKGGDIVSFYLVYHGTVLYSILLHI